MKTSTTLLSTLSALLIFTGCIQPPINTSSNYNMSSTTQELLFSTKEHNFIHSLSRVSTKEERNSYMNEFLLKSDMQCANFLNQPLKRTYNNPTSQRDSLYISIAESIGRLFGLSYITNTAKTVFLEGDNKTSIEEKIAYDNALSPEIRKGVEIARTRFAKEMRKKQPLSLKEYSVEQLKEDTLKYDRQCNIEYGLIEINRALKEVQSQINTRVVTKKPTLDPQVIKDKVAQATQEVKKKQEEEKKRTKAPTNRDNNKTAILSI